MRDEWENPEFAAHWEQAALVNNPSRAEQLDILLSVIAQVYRRGATVLDLGIGSGLVEAQLFAQRDDADVVGVELSAAMIALAKRRLALFEQRYRIVQHNLSDLAGLSLPAKEYQIVISVQVLHHLTHAQQQKVFQFVADILPNDGVFLLMDRIVLDPSNFADIYRAAWTSLERARETKNGWSGDYFLQRLQDKEDYPATLENLLAWLREVGLQATCLHLHLDRALVVGVKK